MSDHPSPLPVEMIEDRDGIGDVGLDIAGPLERAGMEAALLREDTIDEPIELLHQADDDLGTDPGAAVQEECRRALAHPAAGREDLTPGHSHGQGLIAHRTLR
jgi:hypothetical protein